MTSLYHDTRISGGIFVEHTFYLVSFDFFWFLNLLIPLLFRWRERDLQRVVAATACL